MNQNKYDFTSKWSAEVEKWGYTEMPNLLITNQQYLDISNAEMVVLINLLMYKWTVKNPYPAVASLSRHTGMSSNTVRTHLRLLEKKKLLKRIGRKSLTNEYNLVPLINKLRGVASVGKPPAQKRAFVYSKSNSNPYSYLNTKEDAAKNTNKRKRNTKDDTLLVKDILVERYGTTNYK